MIALDRQLRFATGTFAAGATTWTLPYSVATDGSQGTLQVVRVSDESVLPGVTRPSATTIRVTGDFSAIPVAVGFPYAAQVVLSPIYARDERADNRPITNRRLNIQRLFVEYAETPTLTVSVIRAGYPTQTLPKPPGDVGFLRVPVSGRIDQTTITIDIPAPRGGRITNVEWEGFLH